MTARAAADGRGPRANTVDRREFLLAAAGAAGALAVAGCTSSGSRSGGRGGSRPTLRLPYGALGFPSPFASNGDLGYDQMSLLYDTLLWKDGTGRLLPWLAKSVQSSEDHLTHSFELRDDARWGDGQPLTADDVVFTFDYYAKQKTLAPR